jgi:hypothetical protein
MSLFPPWMLSLVVLVAHFDPGAIQAVSLLLLTIVATQRKP